MQFRLSNSQRYLVVGLVGLAHVVLYSSIYLGLYGLALWLVSGLALTKYRTGVNLTTKLHIYLRLFFTVNIPLNLTRIKQQLVTQDSN